MRDAIEYEIAPIGEAKIAILESIKEYFSNGLDDQFIEPTINDDLEAYLDEFKEGLYCIIEYPYVDRVYRNSYYSYYSSKHLSYHRDCIRVTLYSSEVKHKEFIDPAFHRSLKNKFLGYFILRPTVNALFGRSLINPAAFCEDNFQICRHKADCLVFGMKLEVEGFPHSSQDGETIKCAETTIWALMEYFGTRYPDYKPALPSLIYKTLERFSYQRQLPSVGLTMDQISFALKEFGFGTRIYSEDEYGRSLYEIIDCYVESGIPVLVGLRSASGSTGHVVIVIGKEITKEVEWDGLTPRELTISHKTLAYFDTAQLPDMYVVQDDNLQPYRITSLNSPGEHYLDDECKTYQIDSIVVPLYPKIYLEAVVAKQLMFQLIKDKTLGYAFENEFVIRCFLASSRSFKQHISNSEALNDGLKFSLIVAKMPKFVWIAEIYKKGRFKGAGSEAIGIIILDATEANNTSIDALIFAGYPDRCISMIENNFATLQHKFLNYSYYSNLK